MSGPILYPNVTRLTGVQSAGAGSPPAVRPEAPDGGRGRVTRLADAPVPGEFGEAFDQAARVVADGYSPEAVVAGERSGPGSLDFALPKVPLRFSAHAMERLNNRKIALDPAMLSKVTAAVDRAAAKGVQDSLVLVDGTALIVSVKNRTVVTAMDRGSLLGNVFTNIDGAVIV